MDRFAKFHPAVCFLFFAFVIVLDEFLDAVSLFDFDYIKSLSFSPDKEYVITGHTEIAPLFEKADYITEFKKIRHPFDNGASARQGIEF